MDSRRDIFQAIADPTRREIIHLITSKPKNISEISGNFEMKRQSVTLHLKILEECGVISIKEQGRERFCELQLEKLKEVDEWISYYRNFWSARFASLKNLIDEENETKTK